MLNKICKYAGESPLIVVNINIAFSFFWHVERLSQWSLFSRKLALKTLTLLALKYLPCLGQHPRFKVPV